VEADSDAQSALWLSSCLLVSNPVSHEANLQGTQLAYHDSCPALFEFGGSERESLLSWLTKIASDLASGAAGSPPCDGPHRKLLTVGGGW